MGTLSLCKTLKIPTSCLKLYNTRKNQLFLLCPVVIACYHYAYCGPGQGAKNPQSPWLQKMLFSPEKEE